MLKRRASTVSHEGNSSTDLTVPGGVASTEYGVIVDRAGFLDIFTDEAERVAMSLLALVEQALVLKPGAQVNQAESILCRSHGATLGSEPVVGLNEAAIARYNRIGVIRSDEGLPQLVSTDLRATERRHQFQGGITGFETYVRLI